MELEVEATRKVFGDLVSRTRVVSGRRSSSRKDNVSGKNRGREVLENFVLFCFVKTIYL